MQKKFDSVEEYIKQFPEDVQEKLNQIRSVILDAAKDAEETISYNMPAYKQNGVIVYFAGYKSHIGFYPTSKGVAAFAAELKEFKISKGTIQFPLDKKIPVSLVKKIVKHNLKANLSKSKKKSGKLR